MGLNPLPPSKDLAGFTTRPPMPAAAAASHKLQVKGLNFSSTLLKSCPKKHPVVPVSLAGGSYRLAKANSIQRPFKWHGSRCNVLGFSWNTFPVRVICSHFYSGLWASWDKSNTTWAGCQMKTILLLIIHTFILFLYECVLRRKLANTTDSRWSGSKNRILYQCEVLTVTIGVEWSCSQIHKQNKRWAWQWMKNGKNRNTRAV